MTRFQAHWVRVAERFGLVVRIAHAIDLGPRWFVAPVLLESFGARLGMVLVPSYDQVQAFADALVAAGYGYSALGEPKDGDAEREDITYMLREWGWSGSDEPPAWYLELRYATGELVQVGDRVENDGRAGVVEEVIASDDDLKGLGVDSQGVLMNLEGAGRVFQDCINQVSWEQLRLVRRRSRESA